MAETHSQQAIEPVPNAIEPEQTEQTEQTEPADGASDSEAEPGAAPSEDRAEVLDVIEPASSGRAKCRGCGEKIAKGELRFGESVQNQFADGNTTIWFHLDCAAHRRPEKLAALIEHLEANPSSAEAGVGALPKELTAERLTQLKVAAQLGIEHPRATRIAAVERSPSGRAMCRQCREKIAKGALRVKLQIFQDGRFEPIGFIHLDCHREYFGAAVPFERFERHLGELEPDEVEAVRASATAV